MNINKPQGVPLDPSSGTSCTHTTPALVTRSYPGPGPSPAEGSRCLSEPCTESCEQMSSRVHPSTPGGFHMRSPSSTPPTWQAQFHQWLTLKCHTDSDIESLLFLEWPINILPLKQPNESPASHCEFWPWLLQRSGLQLRASGLPSLPPCAVYSLCSAPWHAQLFFKHPLVPISLLYGPHCWKHSCLFFSCWRPIQLLLLLTPHPCFRSSTPSAHSSHPSVPSPHSTAPARLCKMLPPRPPAPPPACFPFC